MSNPTRKLKDFAGGWSLERRIEDRFSARCGRLTGQAVLTPRGGDLLYRENGILTFEGVAPLKAERSYIWAQRADGTIEVRFVDGRRFHEFAPGLAKATAVHLCGKDTYRVTYEFSRWPEWCAVWAVAGPEKDYTSASRFTR